MYVPGDITMMEKGKLRAHLHVDGIVAVPELLKTDIIVPPADSGGPEQLSHEALNRRVIRQSPPGYPVYAKLHHIEGTVVLRGKVAKDGHIRDVELVSATDDSLVDSVLAAVRRWIYSPLVVNGAAREVEADITVNYRFQ